MAVVAVYSGCVVMCRLTGPEVVSMQAACGVTGGGLAKDHFCCMRDMLSSVVLLAGVMCEPRIYDW